MANLVKMSEAAAMALHTMVLLAADRDHPAATRQIASRLKVSEAHLSKVLQRLSKVGLVHSIRGPRGGFTLARPPERISLLAVYEAIEGPLDSSCCVLGTPVCGRRRCIFGDLLETVNRQVRDYFTRTSLADLVEVIPIR